MPRCGMARGGLVCRSAGSWSGVASGMDRRKVIPLVTVLLAGGLLALELLGGEPNYVWVAVAGFALLLGLAGLASGGG